MSNSGAAGGRAGGCSVSDAKDSSWHQGWVTDTECQCTDPAASCPHPAACDFCCPFYELPKNWALGDWRFPRFQKVPSKKSALGGCQGKPPSMLLCLGEGWSWSLVFCPANTAHRLREISLQGQLSMRSMMFPQPLQLLSQSTVCLPPDHIKQCDEHLSHEHLSLLPSFPKGKIEWE